MELLFLIFFILSSQLIHSVASDQQTGFNPYPFGATIFCLLQHPLLLIMSIFYLGWLWGIVLFLCHLFGIVHMTISWVLDIPTLLAKDFDKLIKFMKFKIALLAPMLIVILVFTVVSFFVSDFMALLVLLQNNPTEIIGAAAVIILLSISRLIVAKKVNDAED
ncbi:MAG: hypothetical protein IJO72_02515 [Oscillospiraceae bacterium]|nr:hypothetical protein [Oscillospiraceae bacterium]